MSNKTIRTSHITFKQRKIIFILWRIIKKKHLIADEPLHVCSRLQWWLRNPMTMTRMIKQVVQHSNGLYLESGVGVGSRKRTKKNLRKSIRSRESESKRLKRRIQSRKKLNVEVGVRCRSWKTETLKLKSEVEVKKLNPPKWSRELESRKLKFFSQSLESDSTKN